MCRSNKFRQAAFNNNGNSNGNSNNNGAQKCMEEKENENEKKKTKKERPREGRNRSDQKQLSCKSAYLLICSRRDLLVGRVIERTRPAGANRLSASITK